MSNIFSDSSFSDYDEFVLLYELVDSYADISGIASDSAVSFSNWYNCKSDDLDIPNKDLHDYLIEFKKDCGNNCGVIKSRIASVLLSDRFKSLFQGDRGSSFRQRQCIGSYGTKLSDDIMLERFNKMREFIIHGNLPVIADSMKKCLDYMYYILTQTDDFDLPRIPALLGASGTGKSYICNTLFPYYLSQKIKGKLYVISVQGTPEDTQSKYFFKPDPANHKRIIVGSVAEAVLMANEEGHEDDFFLVIINEYTRAPLSALSEMLSFIGRFNEAYDIGGMELYRKPNFGIIMNGNVRQTGVSNTVVCSEALNSRIVPIYETSTANEGKTSLEYYGICANKDRILAYIKSNLQLDPVELIHAFEQIEKSRGSDILSVDLREVKRIVSDNSRVEADCITTDTLSGVLEECLNELQ